MTLSDDRLSAPPEECRARWGIWGFSVLEIPDGDYSRLERLRPIVAERRQLLVAQGSKLIADGFPLLPTLDAPHWTVTLAGRRPSSSRGSGSNFQGPIPQPCLRPNVSAVTTTDVDTTRSDPWYDANTVGADLVVETWISHGPRADDPTFDPQPGDWVRLGDDDESPHQARVIRRDGNRVWAQIALLAIAAPARSATTTG